MIYRSNLTAPDLQQFFHHLHSRVKPHSQGHDILSDFADKPADDPTFAEFKNCGFFTHDEAAILYNIARMVGGYWLDIGGLTGWTAAHLAAAGCEVMSVDPAWEKDWVLSRARENLVESGALGKMTLWACRSNSFFDDNVCLFDGIVIDGDHEAPGPLLDAIRASHTLVRNGVIVFHDLIYGGPQEGLRYLTEHGWNSKVYSTPHKVGVCWKGSFAPPEHVPDPNLWKEP